MHNLYICARFLEICKHFSNNLENEVGKIKRRGEVPRFFNLEVISLGLMTGTFSI